MSGKNMQRASKNPASRKTAEIHEKKNLYNDIIGCSRTLCRLRQRKGRK